jgi:D-glycero-alpha-D-manno-heptose-7-phosphate kinase
MREIGMLVNQAMYLINARELDDFGKLLHEGWILKRKMGKSISNPTIDAIYDKALTSGALGGKLLGAGSSGFMLFYVPEWKQTTFRESMSPLKEVPFKFDNVGSQVIYSEDTRETSRD